MIEIKSVASYKFCHNFRFIWKTNKWKCKINIELCLFLFLLYHDFDINGCGVEYHHIAVKPLQDELYHQNKQGRLLDNILDHHNENLNFPSQPEGNRSCSHSGEQEYVYHDRSSCIYPVSEGELKYTIFHSLGIFECVLLLLTLGCACTCYFWVFSSILCLLKFASTQ